MEKVSQVGDRLQSLAEESFPLSTSIYRPMFGPYRCRCFNLLVVVPGASARLSPEPLQKGRVTTGK